MRLKDKTYSIESRPKNNLTDTYCVSWRNGDTEHGILVRHGALNPLKSLLKEAGYKEEEP